MRAMKTRLSFLLSSLLFSTLAACGGGPSTDAISAADAESYCRDICEHNFECDSTTDPVETCVPQCTDEVAGWAREDVVADITECEVALACDASREPCFDLCTPTSSHDSYEAACREAMGACDRAQAEIDGWCEVTPGADGDVGIPCLFAPAIVDEMTACFSEADASCSTYDACLEDVIASHGVDL
jgi:hypothetical protein